MKNDKPFLSQSIKNEISFYLPYKYQLCMIAKSPIFMEGFITHYQRDSSKPKLRMFTNYISSFTKLLKAEPYSCYCNYFLSIPIQTLEIKANLSEQDKDLIKLTSLEFFIKNFVPSKKKFKLCFKTEKDIKFTLELFKRLPNVQKYKFDIEGDQNLPYEFYPQLFKYIHNFFPDDFFIFSQDNIISNCLMKKSDVRFYTVYLNSYNIDNLLSFCKEKTNTITKIKVINKSEFESVPQEKIKELIDYNTSSLTEAPNVPLNLLLQCESIKVLNFPFDEENSEKNIENFSDQFLLKIKKVTNVSTEKLELLIPYFKRMKNLKEISLTGYSNKNVLLQLMEGFEDNQVRRIFYPHTLPNNLVDFDKFLSKFPHLIQLYKNETKFYKNKKNCYNVFAYKSVIHMNYEQTGRLLKNNVLRSDSSYVQLLFLTNNPKDIDDFINVIKEKFPEVLTKIEEIIFAGEKSNSFSIPYSKNLIAASEASLKLSIDKIDSLTLLNKTNFKNIFDFVQRTQPLVIKVNDKNFQVDVVDINKIKETKDGLLIKTKEIVAIKHHYYWNLL